MSQAVARSRKKTKERDPLVQRIVEVLDAGVDPDLFERCVCDLLRDAFPSLVPISGGSDQGMDGAIAEGEAEAFPLICTTAEDAARNLRNSLESYGKGRWPRRKAVFVTSRRLTPETRRRLQEIARDRDFRLVQIVDQDGIVDRLYRSARWKKELGVNSAAPALSRVPQSLRPSRGIPLIGREEDVAWLKETSGDRVLSGQPGSGKTHLLRHLVDQGWGLFLVSDDRTEVRNEILERRLDKSSEAAVIVDDAHGNLDRIAMLRQLRDELSGEFPILATCWPGALGEVSSALGAREASTRELQLLTRNQIVEVLAAAGVTEEFVSEHLRADPKAVLRHLVDQAANRPGLAVTLANLALRGDWEETLTGKALKRELSAFRNLLGTDPTPALAAFAFGGEIGMPSATVASYLDSSEAALQRLVIGLAFGGVLEDNPYEKTLAVRPRALRSALLQEVFFQGRPTDLDADGLLGKAHSRKRSIEAVLWSKEAGAVLDQEWIRTIVAESGSLHFWRLFASHGPEEARWVLDNYPGDFLDIAEAALQWLPEAVISKLLEVVSEASQQGGALSGLKDPVEMLKRWLSANRDSMLERRRILAGVATDSLKRGVHQEAALRFLFTALSPRLSTESWDPGLGSTLTVSSYHVGTSELEELEQLWRLAREELPAIQASWLPFLHGALWEWIYPDSGMRVQLPEVVMDQMRCLAREMLVDLAACAGGSVAVRSELKRLSRTLGEPLELELDQEYEILFPATPGSESWRSVRREEEAAAAALADRWTTDEIQPSVERLKELIQAAQRAGHYNRSRLPSFVSALAARVQDPVEWAWSFAEEGLPEDLIEIFLREAETAGKSGWDRVAKQILRSEDADGTVLRFVMTRESPPADLLALAIHQAPRFLHVIHFLGHGAPVATMRRLLESDNGQVAATAVAAEWQGDGGSCSRPREPLQVSWRAAVLRTSPNEISSGSGYWLAEALAENRTLALDWLLRRIEEGLPGLPRGDRVYRTSAQALAEPERVALLRQLAAIQGKPELRFIVVALVGRSPNVYRALLDNPDLEIHHLQPLVRQRPASLDEAWAEMVSLAAEAGHAPEEIVRATIYGSGGNFISGAGLEYWKAWSDGFARFKDDPRPNLRRVAEAGVAFASQKVEEGKKEKRQRELSGF